MAYQPFRGPLGLWPWPILNLILSIIYARVSITASIPQVQASASSHKGFHNIEKFMIKYNEAGDPVEIVVHRKVEPNE